MTINEYLDKREEELVEKAAEQKLARNVVEFTCARSALVEIMLLKLALSEKSVEVK